MSENMKCANCGRVPKKSSMLCVDCLVASSVKILNEGIDMRSQLELSAELFAKMVKRKDGEILKLRVQLRLQRRLMQHIFAEYQTLSGTIKGRMCKKQAVIDELMNDVHGPGGTDG